MPEYIVRAQWNARVRNLPNGDIIARLADGSRIQGEAVENGWVRVRLGAGGAPTIARDGKPLFGYLSMEVLELVGAPPPPPPPPPPISRVRVGLNILNEHDTVAARALALGCNYFMVLNNPGLGERIANEHPNAVVMVRHWWGGHMPSPDDVLTVFSGCRHPRVIYTGLNEADEFGQGGHKDNLRLEELQRRAEFDVAVARKARANGGQYAAGTFSMGTPDFTSPAICEAMQRLYAPHYNEGLFHWDHHLYSPGMGFGPAPRGISRATTTITESVGKSGYAATWETTLGENSRGFPGNNAWIDPIWFETRWRFLFTHCGFNPASPSRVYCSETGVDQGGIGGFPAHGASDADVVRWSKWWAAIQAEPVNGAPSPFVGGAIFQAGNRSSDPGGWAGYNVEGYLDTLSREIWR